MHHDDINPTISDSCLQYSEKRTVKKQSGFDFEKVNQLVNFVS